MKIKDVGGDNISFYCPGCQELHTISTKSWIFNGDYEKPTIEPSILVRSGHYTGRHPNGCWCTYNKEHPDEKPHFKCYQCHSFVRDGMIEFLADCSHELAGQTVSLPDIE